MTEKIYQDFIGVAHPNDEKKLAEFYQRANDMNIKTIDNVEDSIYEIDNQGVIFFSDFNNQQKLVNLAKEIGVGIYKVPLNITGEKVEMKFPYIKDWESLIKEVSDDSNLVLDGLKKAITVDFFKSPLDTKISPVTNLKDMSDSFRELIRKEQEDIIFRFNELASAREAYAKDSYFNEKAESIIEDIKTQPVYQSYYDSLVSWNELVSKQNQELLQVKTELDNAILHKGEEYAQEYVRVNGNPTAIIEELEQLKAERETKLDEITQRQSSEKEAVKETLKNNELCLHVALIEEMDRRSNYDYSSIKQFSLELDETREKLARVLNDAEPSKEEVEEESVYPTKDGDIISDRTGTKVSVGSAQQTILPPQVEQEQIIPTETVENTVEQNDSRESLIRADDTESNETVEETSQEQQVEQVPQNTTSERTVEEPLEETVNINDFNFEEENTGVFWDVDTDVDDGEEVLLSSLDDEIIDKKEAKRLAKEKKKAEKEAKKKAKQTQKSENNSERDIIKTEEMENDSEETPQKSNKFSIPVTKKTKIITAVAIGLVAISGITMCTAQQIHQNQVQQAKKELEKAKEEARKKAEASYALTKEDYQENLDVLTGDDGKWGMTLDEDGNLQGKITYGDGTSETIVNYSRKTGGMTVLNANGDQVAHDKEWVDTLILKIKASSN